MDEIPNQSRSPPPWKMQTRAMAVALAHWSAIATGSLERAWGVQ